MIQNLLTVQNLKKSYETPGQQERLMVLRGLSVDVKEGEFVSIMGPSGCGKSTLLSLIFGLDQADSGKILLDEQDYSQLGTQEFTKFRARKIGMIFQQFHLLPFLTAYENAVLPLHFLGKSQERASESDVMALFHALKLQDRTEHFPAQMSRGECQRTAMIRALVTRPRLILADEPTGSLDPATAQSVMHLLQQALSKTKTALLLVTHDPAMTEFCDRRLRFSEGHLVGS